jgi:hypothetical protein
MPTLTFRLKKRADANAQLTLVREDGSHTSGPVGSADGYFPVHDLTHYVIEQTLGLSEGFLGLVASGWEIKDFEVKGTAKLLSAETLFAENAAGELSRQILMRQPSSAEDLMWVIRTQLKQHSADYEPPVITEELLSTINARIHGEWRRWRELPPNGTLELTFTCSRTAGIPAPTNDQRKRGALDGNKIAC